MENNSKEVKDTEKVEDINTIKPTENSESKEETISAKNIEKIDIKEDNDKEKQEEVKESNPVKEIKDKKSASSIFLYILSLMFLGYMCFNIYETNNYISELIAYGSIDPSSQLNDIISYYMGTCSPYAFYAVTTWALGVLSDKLTKIQNNLKK